MPGEPSGAVMNSMPCASKVLLMRCRVAVVMFGRSDAASIRCTVFRESPQ